MGFLQGLKKVAQRIVHVLRRALLVIKLLKLVIIDRIFGRLSSINRYVGHLEHMPAVPFKLRLVRTLKSLGSRNAQTQQSVQGLNVEFRIDNKDLPAHAFMYSPETVEKTPPAWYKSFIPEHFLDEDQPVENLGDASAADRYNLERGLNNPFSMAQRVAAVFDEDDEQVEDADHSEGLSLERPEQFAMGWTTFPDVYGQSQPLLDEFVSTLTDADAADRLFWPTIARYGMPYNLLFLEKVDTGRAQDLADLFADAWGSDLEADHAAGRLYMIDLRIFESFRPQSTKSGPRFTPGAVVVLRQDADDKTLRPVLIRIAGFEGADAQIYRRGQTTDSAWLYALQAAKAAIGTYGIWLGHVYHWHMPTAAVQMTMYNNLPSHHPLRRLLHPQSQYLIEFDTILLLLWKSIAPPTSITKAMTFLKLIDAYAKGRDFFDDDPEATLERNGITKEDFTVEQDWDQFEFAGHLLELWKITGEYVEDTVDALYESDEAVRNDRDLQKWIRDAANPRQGNLRGLPEMTSRAALRKFLHSYLNRITAHGSSRLPASANPGLTFVANFPPCLQLEDIPSPQAELDTRKLLEHLPNTATIGAYLSFFYIFSFSVPAASVVPPNGVHEDLFFDEQDEAIPGGRACNHAQILFRNRIIEFIKEFQPGTAQVTQWARNIET